MTSNRINELGSFNTDRITKEQENKQMKKITKIVYVTLALLALGCFAISPRISAVVPAPDGAYPGGNTAEGQSALLSLTTGGFNTAVGFFSLRSDTTGQLNTAVGAGTLFANTGDENTATGVGALFSNTTAAGNTAHGAFALFSNTSGSANTAIGESALNQNTSALENTAVGASALHDTTTGVANTAVGVLAPANNPNGSSNTAIGVDAGQNVTTANNVICVGTNVFGENVDNSCYIGNIFDQPSANGVAVLINNNNKLGTTVSSKRFKENIEPMDKASQALFAFKPVTFRYKKEIDPAGKSQFGLVAEDVEKVNPDLVVRDKEGKPYTVRYDAVNTMLLNEFIKEHKKVEQQQAVISQLQSTVATQEANAARQQKQIDALTAGLQKVSAQLELNKPAPQTVLNNR
jgi:hypothetical protein